jgi:hypothetical protein
MDTEKEQNNNNNEEKNNIDEIEKILNKDNPYVTIDPGNIETLQFILSKKIEIVPKLYKGNSYEHVRFRVKEHNSEKEKMFDVNKTSARLIIDKLKEGHRVLNIERRGSGTDTLYIPTPVSDYRE